MNFYTRNILFILLLFIPFRIVAQVEPPLLERVSIINEEGDVAIFWQPGPTPGIEGYIIYKYIGDFQGINTIQLDVVDQFQTSYLVTSTEANQQSVAYVVAAFIIDLGDTIRSALTPPQRTIYLEVVWDPCIPGNDLAWNSYIGWDTHLESYQISWYLSEIGTVTDLGSTNPSDTVFSHYEPVLNENICYLVTAINEQGFESVSNRFCLTTSVLIPPSYVHASFATINDHNHIEIHFQPDPLAQTDLYELYKSNHINGPFDLLERVSHFPPSLFIYEDFNAPLDAVYYYKLIALNQCEAAVIESNIASNILLNLAQLDGTNILSWTPYETWLGGVKDYGIYRQAENRLPSLLGSVENHSSGFSDNPGEVLQQGLTGEFCYFLIANEGDTNPLGFKSSSRSNTVCAFSEPEILIPNAFTPDGDGVNDHFTIFSTFVPKSYHLIIYDRWRNIVFESKDFSNHWNGINRQGSQSTEGIYTYILSIVTQSGRKMQRTGQVAIVYP
jgi:gliding motility-associated-like protein